MKIVTRLLACARATAYIKWKRLSKMHLSTFFFSKIETGEKEIKFDFQEKNTLKRRFRNPAISKIKLFITSS